MSRRLTVRLRNTYHMHIQYPAADAAASVSRLEKPVTATQQTKLQSYCNTFPSILLLLRLLHPIHAYDYSCETEKKQLARHTYVRVYCVTATPTLLLQLMLLLLNIIFLLLLLLPSRPQ